MYSKQVDGMEKSLSTLKIAGLKINLASIPKANICADSFSEIVGDGVGKRRG